MKLVAIFAVILVFVFCQADAFKKQGQNVLGRKPLNSTKGKEIIHPRIVNGKIAHPGQFPYMVCLKMNERGGCGGALITNFWVLTAGHCLFQKERVVVYLGSIKLREGLITFNIARDKLFVHAGYDQRYRHDIGLIKIPYVRYSPYIAPISIPPVNFQLNAGSVATISGWGRTSTNGRPSSTLLYSDVRAITNEACATMSRIGIDNYRLCTISHLGGAPCTGDSGGPLVEKSSHVLVGINAYRMSTKCVSSKPDGYTRVSSYLDWIHNHTGNLT